jgi:dephospho-CoA kinase
MPDRDRGRDPGRRPSRRRGPWKHGAIPVVGLLGGIGAGKSQVAADLAGRGAFVLDADAVGHALLRQRPAREQVLRRFGPEVLDADGEVDRRKLGALVFDDPPARRDLEAILHPKMRRTFEKAIARAVRRGEARAIVLDAAILLEVGWDDLCDLVAFVDASAEVRLGRLAAQRGWGPVEVEARERAQWPLDRKRAAADLTLTNDGDPAALAAEVDRLWARLAAPPPPSRRRPPEPAARGRD